MGRAGRFGRLEQCRRKETPNAAPTQARLANLPQHVVQREAMIVSPVST